VLDALDQILGPHVFPPRPEGGDPRQCPNCGTGRLAIKIGRFGAFVGCSNYNADPPCKFTRAFTANGENGEAATKKLGEDPITGLEVTLRSGRFGPYVQLGEAQDGEKPKRAALPKGTEAASVDLEFALKLLSLPREVGKHPEDGEPILAGIGRYGPYVQHGKTYANLDSGDDVFALGLNRAVTLIAEKIARGPSRRFGADPGRPLGDHPEKGGPVAVKKGRYGPYVSHAGVNATLPKDKTPEDVTLAEAVALLAARAEQKSGGTPAPRRASGRKTAGKTAANKAKKPPAKPPAKKRPPRIKMKAAE